MKNNDVIVNEVILRAKIVTDKKISHMIKRNCLYTVAFIVSLFISVCKIIEIEIPHHVQSQVSYGATLHTFDNISIYATIAVVMFVLGAIFTIICMNLKNKGG
ncbi:MAG: hypothetical protein R3Y35_04325 [Clostridia bacterium]